MSAPRRAVVESAELAAIEARHGAALRREVALDLDGDAFGRQDAAKLFGARADRRGEVALVVEGPDGRILLHTKAFYPAGAFRIPTGGILPGEDVLRAVARESREETGETLAVRRFLGLVRFSVRRGGGVVDFATWLFHVAAPSAPPVALDVDEDISGFRWVPRADLGAVAAALRALPPAWAAWGAFRAAPHELAAAALGDEPSPVR